MQYRKGESSLVSTSLSFLFFTAALLRVVVLRKQKKRVKGNLLGNVKSCTNHGSLVEPFTSGLGKDLTIVITTSPVKSNPSTALFEELISSFHIVEDLNKYKVKIILICDGYKLQGDVGSSKWKSGRVSIEAARNYEGFISNVRKLVEEDKATQRFFGKLSEMVVVELAAHAGFSFAVKTAIEKFVKTEFVMIVQHDNTFIRDFNLKEIVEVLKCNREEVKYVVLNSSSTLQYNKTLDGKYNFTVTPHAFAFHDERSERKMTLTPLVFFYDKTHIASTEYYREFVFNSNASGLNIKKGQFIEDTLGQFQLRCIKEKGISAHKRFATWLYLPQVTTPQLCVSDGASTNIPVDERIIAHLDGRGFITPQRRASKFFRNATDYESYQRQRKVCTSAICIIVDDPKLRDSIESIRCNFDKNYRSWPPHVMLLQPFVPEDAFKQAASELRRKLFHHSFDTLEICLSQLCLLEGVSLSKKYPYVAAIQIAPRSFTVDAQTKGEESTSQQLALLRNVCSETFPFCEKQGSSNDDISRGFLVVGKFKTKEQFRRFQSEVQWVPQPLDTEYL